MAGKTGGLKKKSMKDKGYYLAYRSAGMKMRNKKRKLLKHIKLYPRDLQAQQAAARLKA